MLNQNLLLAGDDAYNLTRSLRFRSSASAYLNRTPASAGNRKLWTWSGWLKRGVLGGNSGIFSAVSGLETLDIAFEGNTGAAGDTLRFVYYTGAALNGNLVSTPVYRDTSGWYHIVAVWDTDNATASNRMRLYVNGVEITAFGTSSYPSSGTVGLVNNTVAHAIGRYSNLSRYYDGYLTEVNFIDGQALTPSSFGATNAQTGVWQPARYTGSYGTNGFYLPFTDNSALTTSSNAGLGKDFSGNGNYWTTNNISVTSGATYDSMTDVPTLTSATTANYAVMNPLNSSSSMTPSSGNLNVITSSVSVSSVSTISVNSGKWYCEITIASAADSTLLGIAPSNISYLSGAFYSVTGGVAYYVDGTKFVSGSQSSYGASYTTGDVIGIALDMDAGTVVFYKNNTSQGTAASGLTGGYYFAVGDGSSGSNTTYNVNFGQRPFTYTPPSGFVALNTFNLPTPTIGATASTQANKYFDATAYTGTGANQSITNSGSMQPDLLWIKIRNTTGFHAIGDAVRGAGSGSGGLALLSSNATDAEYSTNLASYIVSLNSNGFTVGNQAATAYFTNTNGNSFVGWQWKANGSGSSNTSGSITSTVSANTSAGFSIVTFTTPASGNFTVGHGLGVAPAMFILKTRNGVDGWYVYHQSLTTPASNYLTLNATSAVATSTSIWGNTNPTSTVLTLGTNAGIAANLNGVLYCFAQIAGYSAFGSYTGNGSSDGTFVFTGFRPKFILVKRTDAADDWSIYDTTRLTYNPQDLELFPNSSSAEYDGNRYIDILSNGFKLRLAGGAYNTNGATMIYMAVAENPFKYSVAR